MSTRKKLWLMFGLGLFALLFMGLLGIYRWASQTAAPMPEALSALNSSASVSVATEPWLIFEPTGDQANTGFIFYPGGKVDPRAYAPAAHALAEAGTLVVIVPMPLNLAVLAPNRADDVIEAYPGISHWALGGHSLGGAMAASYASKHASKIDGLILWASYPAQGASPVHDTDLAAASIFGTNDGLVSLDDIERSGELLPSTTRWTSIQGGNHAQFGWYGPQEGDNPATISREEQQAIIVAASSDLLETLPAR